MEKKKIIKGYCPQCNKITKLKIIHKMEESEIKGQNIISEAEIPVCIVCGSEVFVEEYEEKNLDKAYNVFRKQNNLLFVDEIKEIRKKYGLSQSDMAKALGWGNKTITRYENGDLPNKSHNELLRLIKDPDDFRNVFENNKNNLTENEIKRIEKALNNNKMDFDNEIIKKILEHYKNIPAEYRGNIDFDLIKLENLIIYLSKEIKDLFKTKLNKILFYIDFIAHKKNGRSITGLCYIHLDYGPVADKYDIILNVLIDKEIIEEKEKIYPNYSSGIIYESKKDVKMDIFNEKEIETIKFVIKKVKSLTSKELSDLSHKEKAYINTSKREKISYKFSKTIKL